MKVSFELPVEFVKLCARDGMKPEDVLKGFIADLCGINDRHRGYFDHGSDERSMAYGYYNRCGHNVGWCPKCQHMTFYPQYHYENGCEKCGAKTNAER